MDSSDIKPKLFASNTASVFVGYLHAVGHSVMVAQKRPETRQSWPGGFTRTFYRTFDLIQSPSLTCSISLAGVAQIAL